MQAEGARTYILAPYPNTHREERMTQGPEKVTRPKQEQPQQPGYEHEMEPQPKAKAREYKGSGKLQDKVAVITGGDSGIGRAVAVLFAREGADIAVMYLNEDKDAEETCRMVEKEGRRCIMISGDIGDEKFCRGAVGNVINAFGRLDILVNNAAEQHPVEDIMELSADQLERTFRTNIFSIFYMVKAALPHLKEGSTIINTTSVTAYRGSSHLVDYASTKGAIVSFTRSLAEQLAEKGIRVNGVAPGPIWTPLIPATFPGERVETFGTDVPLKRAGEPEEVAPSFVYLASEDSSYVIGQILHVNGGGYISS
jgi:NAD(P)-dependent dehydrogenase (short-subunit alcohol dehydrogenase family)